MLVSVIVPVFNEVENITLLYGQLLEVLKDIGLPYEILFVNDGSTDGSLLAMKKIAAEDSKLKIISFVRNYGQTAALSAGIKSSSGDVLITIDADLQNDPADIPTLLKKINEGYDLVSGWRQSRQDKWFSRKLPSILANSLISYISGVKLHDYGCTLKAYRREIVEPVHLYGDMHRLIPIYTKQLGARITEIVVQHHPRKFGKSKYNIRRVPRVIFDLLTVKFLSDYSTKPMYFFGGCGMICFVFGLLSFLLALILRFEGIATLIETPLPLLSIFFFLVGVQCLLMGLLAEMIMRNYFESQDKTPYTIKEKINF